MKKSRFYLCFALFLALGSLSAIRSEEKKTVSIEGRYSLSPFKSESGRSAVLEALPENLIVAIPRGINASCSRLIMKEHSINIYPGAVFKIEKERLVPLTGRFEFSTEEGKKSPIAIAGHGFNAGYTYGQLLIEATPDNGVFFALKNSGKAWLKDDSRNVYELKSGQQVQVPKFGKAILKKRLEAFWGKKPSSFGELGEVGQETSYGIIGK